jgi:hypothetical protein
MANSSSALDRLDVLAGEWVMESKKFGGRGRMTVEGFDDGFIRLRSIPREAGAFPSSTWIIGADDGGGECTCLYGDSRGVRRVYKTTVEERVWKIWRSAPEFNQRYIGKIAKDGSSILGQWEFSKDGSSWEVDFDLSYNRA